ncbi:MAG TPA: DUF4410 domain-containing protein [Thermoanaerobaculia bacterium]|nr:DUF4410 domain-containing protein [Thermoanaerobaculia bacterium]
MKRIALLLAVSLAVAPLAVARGKKDVQTEPGKYTSWGEAEIDEIEIVKAFDAGDYETIAVLPFDTSKIEASGEKGVIIQGALDGYTAVFVEGLRDDLESGAKVEIVDKAPKKAAKTLIVRGAVAEIDPGSRAKRTLAGFGAGAARNKVSVELVDAKTGDVLIRFTQAHRSAGTFKFAGGSDAQVLRDGTRAMGEDTAQILNVF